MTGTPFRFRYQARRWMAGFLAGLCLLTQSVFAHQSETTFWAERKQHLAASKQKPPQTALATPLTTLPLASRGEISLAQNHHSPETTLPSWLKNLPLPGTFRSAHWQKAPGEGPLVFLVEDLHSLYDAQKNVAALLSGMREAILRQRGEDPLIGLEGGVGSFHFQEFLVHKHHPRYTEACDTLLKKNLIQGPEWLALSSADLPTLWGAENPQLYGEHLKSFRALWPRREKDLAEVDRQREILKGHIKDVLSPEQQRIQILLDAFTEGGVGLLPLTQALRYKINPAQAPHLNQLLVAADSETSLNFAQAEGERRELARLLLQRGSPTPTPAPGESAQTLGTLLSSLGLSWDPFPAYAAYLRYADAVDRLDRFALFEEMSRLRQQLSRDPEMSPALQTSLQLRERLRLARRLISRDMTPSDWKAWENTSSIPPDREPWIENIQVFLNKLQPYNSFYQWADRRSAALIQRLDEERKNQNLSCAILVAGGFHTADLQTYCDRQGLSSVVVTPLVENAPKSTPHLSLLAREQIPLTELLAGDKLQLALGRPLSDMPSQFLCVSRDTVLQVFLRLLGEVPEPLLSIATTLLTKVDVSLLATWPALFSPELFSSLAALGATSTTHPKDEHPLPREDRGIHDFYERIERTFDPDKIVVGFADVDHLGLLNTLLGKALLGDLSGQKLAGAELFNVPLFRMFFEVFRDELKGDGIDLFHGPGGDEMRLCYYKEKGAIEPNAIRKAAARAVTAFNKRFQEFDVFEITPPQDKDGNASASDEETLKVTLKDLYKRVGNLGPSSRGGGRWLLLLPKSEQTPSEISENILNILKTEKYLHCQVRHLDFESGNAETSRGFATLTLGLVNLGGLKNYLAIKNPSNWALLMAGFFVANDLSVTMKENGVRNASLYLHNPDDFLEHTNRYDNKRIESFMDHPPSPPTAQQLEEDGVDHLLGLPTPGAFRDQARRLRGSGSLSLVESRPVSYTGEIHSSRAFHGAQTRLGSHHGGNELIKKLMGDILEKTQKARRLLAGRSPPDGLMTIIAETPANAMTVAPGQTFRIEVEDKPFDITVVETVTAFDPQNPGQAYKTSSDLHQLAALILSQREEDGSLNTTKNLENLKNYARVKVISRDRRPALIRLSPKRGASKLINEFLKKETAKTYERIIQSPAVASVFPNLFKNPSLPSTPQIPSYEQAIKDLAGLLSRGEDVVIAAINFDWLSTLRGVYGPHLLGNWDDTPTPATYIKEGTTSLQSQLLSSLLNDPGDIKFYIGPAADKLVAIASKTPSEARTFFHQRVDRVRAQFRDRYGVIRMEGSIDEAQLVGWAKDQPSVLKIVPYAGGLHILIDSRETQVTETPLITTLADTVGSLQKIFSMASVFPISLERKSRGVFSLSVGAIRSRQATLLSPGAPGVLLLASKAAEWAKENGHDQTYCAFSEPELSELNEHPDPLANKSLTRQEIWPDTLSRWLGKDHFLEKWKDASTPDNFQNWPSLEVVENIWDVLQAHALKGGRINTWFQNVQTARQLLDWGADANTVLAGLLGQEPADKIKDIINLEPIETLSSLALEMESFTFRLDNDLKSQPDLVHDALGAYISRLPQAGEMAWPVLLLDTARRQTGLSHEFRQNPSRDIQRIDELKWIHSLLLEWLGRHEMAAALRDRLFFLQSPEKRDEATSFFSQDTYLTYEGAEKWLKNLASRISATPLTQKDGIPEKAKVMATRAKQPHSLNRKKDSWAVQDLLGIALAMPHFDLNGQRNSLKEIKDWLSHFGEVIEKKEEKGKRGVKTSDSKYGYDGYHVYLRVTDPETYVERTVELILFPGEYNYWRYRSGTGARFAYTLEREMPAQGIYWTTRQLSGDAQADLKAIQEEILGYTFIQVSLPGKENPVHLSFPPGSLVCDLMADLRINPEHKSYSVKDNTSIKLKRETPLRPNTLYTLENSEEQLSIPDKAQSPGSLLMKISQLPIENPSDESFKSFLYQVRNQKNKALINILNRTHLTGQEERFFRLIQWLEINQPEHSLLLDYQQALAEKCRLRHTPHQKGSGRIDILIAYDRPGVLAEALRRAKGNGFVLKEYPEFDSPGKDMRVRLSLASFQEENLKARFERLLEQLKGLDDRPVGQTSALAPGNGFELVVKPTGQASQLDSLILFEDLILALENAQANLLAIEKPGDENNLNLRILFTLDDTGKGVLENYLQGYFEHESHRYILRKIGLGQSSSSPSNSNLGLWTLWEPWISTRSEGWKTRLAVVFAMIVEEAVFLGGWLIFADLLGSFISGGVIAPGQLLHGIFASGLLEAPSFFSQAMSPDLLLPLALSFLLAHWATTYLAHPRLAHWESGRVVFEKNRASLQQKLSLSRDLAITRLFTLFLGPWVAVVINAVSHGAYEFRNGENLPQVKRKLSKFLRGVKENSQLRLEALRLLRGLTLASSMIGFITLPAQEETPLSLLVDPTPSKISRVLGNRRTPSKNGRQHPFASVNFAGWKLAKSSSVHSDKSDWVYTRNNGSAQVVVTREGAERVSLDRTHPRGSLSHQLSALLSHPNISLDKILSELSLFVNVGGPTPRIHQFQFIEIRSANIHVVLETSLGHLEDFFIPYGTTHSVEGYPQGTNFSPPELLDRNSGVTIRSSTEGLVITYKNTLHLMKMPEKQFCMGQLRRGGFQFYDQEFGQKYFMFPDGRIIALSDPNRHRYIIFRKQFLKQRYEIDKSFYQSLSRFLVLSQQLNDLKTPPPFFYVDAEGSPRYPNGARVHWNVRSLDNSGISDFTPFSGLNFIRVSVGNEPVYIPAMESVLRLGIQTQTLAHAQLFLTLAQMTQNVGSGEPHAAGIAKAGLAAVAYRLVRHENSLALGPSPKGDPQRRFEDIQRMLNQLTNLIPELKDAFKNLPPYAAHLGSGRSSSPLIDRRFFDPKDYNQFIARSFFNYVTDSSDPSSQTQKPEIYVIPHLSSLSIGIITALKKRMPLNNVVVVTQDREVGELFQEFNRKIKIIPLENVLGDHTIPGITQINLPALQDTLRDRIVFLAHTPDVFFEGENNSLELFVLAEDGRFLKSSSRLRKAFKSLLAKDSSA